VWGKKWLFGEGEGDGPPKAGEGAAVRGESAEGEGICKGMFKLAGELPRELDELAYGRVKDGEGSSPADTGALLEGPARAL
jgi:hypothetical protein